MHLRRSRVCGPNCGRSRRYAWTPYSMISSLRLLRLELERLTTQSWKVVKSRGIMRKYRQPVFFARRPIKKYLEKPRGVGDRPLGARVRPVGPPNEIARI